MPAGKVHYCWNCGGELTSEKPGRREDCPACRADVHVCKNCRFWDVSYENECRETQAERVVDKERSNFCDYFEWREGKPGGKGGSDISALEDLFKS